MKDKDIFKILNQILKEMAKMKDISEVADKYNGDYYSYYRYFQKEIEKKTKKFIPAKEMVRMLYWIRSDSKTQNEVKAVIDEIFIRMDPRDYSWVWGECQCERCRKNEKIFLINDSKIN